MAAKDVAAVIRKNGGVALATVAFVTVFLVALWTNDLLGMTLRSLRPRRAVLLNNTDRPRASKFVSLCSSNFDGRRLGNQLFNWAAMLYTARLTGGRPAMLRHHPYGWIDRWFDVGDVERVDALSNLCPCAKITDRRSLTFDHSLATRLRQPPFVNASTILLCGLYQSWKYASAVSDELRRRLRWKPKIISAVRRFLDDVRPTDWTGSFMRVGIHVRAGDIRTLFNLFYGFTVPGSSYFVQAANYLVANLTVPAQFIFTTDNLTWTKENVALEAVFWNRSTRSVIYSERNGAAFDMALLSSCDALIMSTGSYGWWAAWLANKTTVYYRNWPRARSLISTMFTREDYFPPNWIGLGTESDHTKNIRMSR